MQLENVVVDAVDPGRLGRFWETVVGGERLTDSDEGYETRLAVDDGPVLDLCFQPVAEPSTGRPRLHVELLGGARQSDEVARLLALGARPLDPGQDDLEASRVVLADPEGNPFCVTAQGAAHPGTGPVAALPLDSADPDRDAAFWSWLTGWTDVAGAASRSLRHPSGRGPLLELRPERAPKDDVKNRWHLDVRLEPGEDADEVGASILARGGRRLVTDWGELPWRSYRDPSGNELCVLPAPEPG